MSSLTSKIFIMSALIVFGLGALAQDGATAPSSNDLVMRCVANPGLPECERLATSSRGQVRGVEEIRTSDSDSELVRKPKSQSSTELPPQLFPPELPTEFEQFVMKSYGKRVPVFGSDLFKQVPSTFAPADQVAVPVTYVIGPGDELQVRAWGQIDLQARVIVDRSGAIYIPRVGSISVSGVKYQDLAGVLRSEIGRVFRNFELVVTLGRLRSIQIFVVGQARRPGSYTVSSLSTMVNALFASGGPSSAGSMRRIQLKRDNEVVSELDLYDLLLQGDKAKDVVLLPGDVIYVPPVGPQVAIVGSVKFPAIYELTSELALNPGTQVAEKLEINTSGNSGVAVDRIAGLNNQAPTRAMKPAVINELQSITDLRSGLELAGGLTNTADGDRVIVERIDGHSTRSVDEFKLDAAGMSRPLRDGDIVRVFQISPRFENAVTLRGNVIEPGRYPWRPGMRIRDLIPNREFLLTRQFWEQQNRVAAERKFGTSTQNPLRRTKSDKSRIQSTAASNSEDARTEDPSENVSREAGAPKDGFDRSNNEEPESARNNESDVIQNDVKLNAPDINWEYAVIQRIDKSTLTTTLIPFNLGRAILESSDSDNVALQAGDIVTIFSQMDIAVSFEKRSKFVRLEGEFRAPGVYKVQPDETMRQLVERAGGLTDRAYMNGAVFTRESARKEQQRSLDEMVQNLDVQMQRRSMYMAQARPEQQAALSGQGQSEQNLIEKLRRVKATGRVVLEIAPGDLGAAALPSLPLEDGDRIFVPATPSTISVVGSVYNQSSFVFKTNTRIADYLKLAGGGNRDSDTKHMFVIRASGTVVSREGNSGIFKGDFANLRAYPGDMLVVPAQIDKGTFMRGLKDWSQVISQFGLGVAAVAVLAGK